MKKENRKMAQELRAKERAAAARRKKTKKIVITVLVLVAVAVVAAGICGGCGCGGWYYPDIHLGRKREFIFFGIGGICQCVFGRRGYRDFCVCRDVIFF